MNKKTDFHLIAESYDAIYNKPVVTEAAPQQTQQKQQSAARIKDMQGFNTNLNAIDQLEDKMIEFVSSAQKTGWMSGQEIAGAQKVLQSFLTSTILSLLASTNLKDQNQMQQALSQVKSKIKFVDVNHITSLYQQIATGQRTQQQSQQQAAAGTATPPSAAGASRPNYGAMPGSFRFQQALDTVNNFTPGGNLRLGGLQQ